MYLSLQTYVGDVGDAVDNGSGLIKITCDSHGLTTGQCVIIQDVEGCVEANGVWIITVVDTSHFTLDGSTFSNAWTTGGTVGQGETIRITFTGTLTTDQSVVMLCAYRNTNGVFVAFASKQVAVDDTSTTVVISSHPSYATQVESIIVASNESSNAITFEISLLDSDGLELTFGRASLTAGYQWTRSASGSGGIRSDTGQVVSDGGTA